MRAQSFRTINLLRLVFFDYDCNACRRAGGVIVHAGLCRWQQRRT